MRSQERNWDAFVYQLAYFSVLATAFILLAVYQFYLNQWLQIRWRRWLTRYYLDLWLADANHYRMQLLGDAADNPDQRIAEDVAQFIQFTLNIGLQLLNAVVTLLSFMVILWSLSAAAPLVVFGVNVAIPGYLLWAALIYAVIGTAFTHLIGRPLIALNFQQQRYEADFRFNLVRVRESSEQIALLDGEPAERDRLLLRFGSVVANWMAIMSRQKKLTFFTARLCPGVGGVSVHPRQPGLFRRRRSAWRPDADRQRVRPGAGCAVDLRHAVPQSRRVARGDRTAGRLRSVGAGSPCDGGDAARHHGHAGRRRSGHLQGPDGAAAERGAAGQRHRHLHRPRRAGAGQRAVRLGQVDAVPGLGRRLAVRGRHHHGAQACQGDDAAAAAVFPDRAAGRRGCLSGGARHLRCQQRWPN